MDNRIFKLISPFSTVEALAPAIAADLYSAISTAYFSHAPARFRHSRESTVTGNYPAVYRNAVTSPSTVMLHHILKLRFPSIGVFPQLISHRHLQRRISII